MFVKREKMSSENELISNWYRSVCYV